MFFEVSFALLAAFVVWLAWRRRASGNADKVTLLARGRPAAERLPQLQHELKRHGQALNLQDYYLGPEGAESLAAALATNTSLTRVDLCSCQVRDAGATALAAVLESHASITDINLCNNRIRAAGAFSLATALKNNTTLTAIALGTHPFGLDWEHNKDLYQNQIDLNGAAELADVLKGRTPLRRLNLRGNRLCDAGVTFLADAVSQNTRLTELDVSHNAMGELGLDALVNALTANTSLTAVNLGNNPFESASGGKFDHHPAIVRLRAARPSLKLK
jgi:Ran GTPase-activating protein (RanGAP) involved in mRNA processing and transport